MSVISNEKKIKSIEKKQDYLSIIYTDVWYQEDITILAEQLLMLLMSIAIQEKNIGADREDIRFNWNNHFFVLNFDYYSQSCWIEGQDHTETTYIDALYLALTQ